MKVSQNNQNGASPKTEKPLFTISIQKMENGDTTLSIDNTEVTHNQIMMILQGMIFQLQESAIMQKLRTEVQIIKPGSMVDMRNLMKGGQHGKFQG